MNKVTWIIFGAIVVAVLGGLVIYSRVTNPPADISNVDPSVVLAASAASGDIADHVKGSPEAKVVLVEYGDFQCPYCGSVYPYVGQVTEKYGDSIAFVFRNFPLTNAHPNAKAAAAVAETAGLQGKYWEMYNALFTNQSQWSSLTGTERTSGFAEYARQVGLDVDAFNTALTEKADQVNKKIAFDVALGKKLGVTGTPTFFLNGTRITDDVVNSLQRGDIAPLSELIDAELRKAGVEVPAA